MNGGPGSFPMMFLFGYLPYVDPPRGGVLFGDCFF